MTIKNNVFIQKACVTLVVLSMLLSNLGPLNIQAVQAKGKGPTPTPTLTGTPTAAPAATVTAAPSDTPTVIPTVAPAFTPTVSLTPTATQLTPPDLAAAGTGTLFRARITLKNSHDLQRLKEWNISVLAQDGDYVYVEVDNNNLERLARLGFSPDQIDSLEYLATVYNATQFTSAPISKASLSASPKLLMSLSSVDSDQDGLTDTEEVWWCTDPLNPNSDHAGLATATDPNDGAEVAAIQKGITTYGPPFAMWPNFKPYHADGNCPDGDFDAVPDNAELYMLGTSPQRESSDLDKFDDGQELFGVTFCPGSSGTCGYGILPRAEDSAYVSANLPAWVKAPGNSPFVAAFPKPEVEVVPSSLILSQKTVITNTKGTVVGTEKTYGTTSTKGTSTSLANQTTWNSWQEVSVAVPSSSSPITLEPVFNIGPKISSGLSAGLHLAADTLGILGAIGGAGAACVASAGITLGVGCYLAVAGAAGAITTLTVDSLDHQSQVKVFMKLSRIERKPMVPVYRIYACV